MEDIMIRFSFLIVGTPSSHRISTIYYLNAHFSKFNAVSSRYWDLNNYPRIVLQVEAKPIISVYRPLLFSQGHDTPGYILGCAHAASKASKSFTLDAIRFSIVVCFSAHMVIRQPNVSVTPIS